MITRSDLTKTARAHLRDAGIRYRRGSYDGASYLCGYAVEIALKARICRTLRWSGFPSTPGEFQNVKSVQTHNFEALLFTGLENRIKVVQYDDWVIVKKWTPEHRYNPVGTQTNTDAADIIVASRTLLEILL